MLVILPNGDAVSPDTVTAVLYSEAQEKSDFFEGRPPAVIVQQRDLGFGLQNGSCRSFVIPYGNEDQAKAGRDQIIADLRAACREKRTDQNFAGELLEALELLQGFDFRLDESDHAREIRRRVVAAIEKAKTNESHRS